MTRRAALSLQPAAAFPSASDEVAPEIEARFAGRPYLRRCGDVVAGVVREAGEYRFAWLVGDGEPRYLEHDRQLALADGGAPTSPHFSPGGTRVAFSTRHSRFVIFLDPRSGAFSAFEPENTAGNLEHVAFVGDDALVLRWEPVPRSGRKGLDGRHIDLLRLREGEWVCTDTAIVTKSRASVASGRYVAVLADGAKRLTILAVDGEALVEVGALRDPIRRARFADDGALYVVSEAGAVYRVAGLEAVAAKKLAAAAKKRAKA